jgi:hypothetical protein
MQNYSKILIERGWRARAALNVLPSDLSLKSQRYASEGLKLDRPAYFDLRGRMDASARQFGQPHAYLFPLIGKRVVTPRGLGQLKTVFAQRCEVILDVDPERIACFAPEEVGLAA